MIGGTSQGINMPDNIAFQPGRGQLRSCTRTPRRRSKARTTTTCGTACPTAPDQDLLSDGCVRIATLNDLTAEWTGGIFDASGTHFYVSIQHNISGKATILDITGWD